MSKSKGLSELNRAKVDSLLEIIRNSVENGNLDLWAKTDETSDESDRAFFKLVKLLFEQVVMSKKNPDDLLSQLSILYDAKDFWDLTRFSLESDLKNYYELVFVRDLPEEDFQNTFKRIFDDKILADRDTEMVSRGLPITNDQMRHAIKLLFSIMQWAVMNRQDFNSIAEIMRSQFGISDSRAQFFYDMIISHRVEVKEIMIFMQFNYIRNKLNTIEQYIKDMQK